MGTDLWGLRILSDLSMVAWLVVSLTTLRWFAVANGHRPIVSGIVGLAGLALLSAVSLSFASHSVSYLVAQGWELWGVYSLRVYSILGAFTLYITGRRVMDP